jgi:hypothetical protein
MRLAANGAINKTTKRRLVAHFAPPVSVQCSSYETEGTSKQQASCDEPAISVAPRSGNQGYFAIQVEYNVCQSQHGQPDMHHFTTRLIRMYGWVRAFAAKVYLRALWPHVVDLVAMLYLLCNVP